MTKPFIVFVFATERSSTSPRFGGFAGQLKAAKNFPDYDVVTVALENLAFVISEDGKAQVADTVTGVSLADAAFVYLKSWESMIEEAAALTNFLFYSRIPFSDTLPLGMGVSKLATSFRLWGAGIALPLSIYVRRADRLAEFLADYSDQELGDTFIVKDINGQKGQLNFLVARDKAIKLIKEHLTVQFVCQRFIKNNGDYRVGVYLEAPSFAIKRAGVGNTHLNNTSMGGVAEFLPIHEVPTELLEISVNAARAARLQVAGVDIIIDEQTGRAFVLEVNQGSQIVTGAFVDENKQAFNRALSHRLAQSRAPQVSTPLSIIGRRTQVELPQLGIISAVAKVDTGAYESSVHAERIRLEKRAGVEYLVFEIAPQPKLMTSDNKPHEICTVDFKRVLVMSSNGIQEARFSINTTIIINGQPVAVPLNLTDRTPMNYPILLGRTVLHGRFLIDVELTEKLDQTL